MSKYWSDEVARQAVALVGRPYVIDGWSSDEGFSCWSLVHHVFALSGIDLTKDVYHAAQLFQGVAPPYRPLDVVYFKHAFVPDHLGVMVNAYEVLHASEATNGVAKRAISRRWYQVAISGVFRLKELR